MSGQLRATCLTVQVRQKVIKQLIHLSLMIHVSSFHQFIPVSLQLLLLLVVMLVIIKVTTQYVHVTPAHHLFFHQTVQVTFQLLLLVWCLFICTDALFSTFISCNNWQKIAYNFLCNHPVWYIVRLNLILECFTLCYCSFVSVDVNLFLQVM